MGPSTSIVDKTRRFPIHNRSSFLTDKFFLQGLLFSFDFLHSKDFTLRHIPILSITKQISEFLKQGDSQSPIVLCRNDGIESSMAFLPILKLLTQLKINSRDRITII
ncbi:MAG: hypothetical protein EBX30_12810, partial [Betaproteobacteria bacterium]|nr:hypothetical protein [Betaproteobacteria bacterium]